MRKETATAVGSGLGRAVVADSQMLQPRLHGCARTTVAADDRTVSVSWVRSASQGLHSVSIDYEPAVVRVGVRVGTRPSATERKGAVVLRMVVEHTTIRLREPLHGRRLETLQPETALRRSS